jgi:molybdopterin/thiamine biosynthesis adenylyltransferase
VLKVRAFLEMLYSRCTDSNKRAFLRWLTTIRLPLAVLFSFRLGAGSDRVLGCAWVPLPGGKDRAKADAGFRPGNAKANMQIHACMEYAIRRFSVARADPAFLLRRTSGMAELRDKTVVVAGCGSVGSFIAAQLASSGIGKLRLIDSEELGTENIHRHYLGADCLDTYKAESLGAHLKSRFPHLEIESRRQKLEHVLSSEQSFIEATDLIVCSTGEETLQRRMEEVLVPSLPRLYVWIEAYGVGGHALLTGLSGPKGCYDCLFDTRECGERLLLTNLASLIEPGQELLTATGGCSGLFLPYGVLAAEQAALEASRLAVRFLQDTERENCLVSWFGDAEEFVAKGFSLSARGRELAERHWLRTTQFGREGCRLCQLKKN